MKKALFFLMLLPCLAVSQTLAKWTNQTPGSIASNMNAYAFTGAGGVSIQENQNEAFGFLLMGWHTQGLVNPTLTESKYLEFTAAPHSGFKINPSQFKINLNSSSQAPRKLQVKASVNGSTWVNLTNAATSQNEVSMNLEQNVNLTMNFPSGYVVMPSETLRIRVYMYDCSDTYYTKNFLRSMNYPTGNADGPTLTGTVTSAAGISPLPDTDAIFEGASVTRDVTSNDIFTGTTLTNVEIIAPFVPAGEGAATINGNSITFTATASTGAKVIRYKVYGTGGYSAESTYTVTVNAYPSPTANNDTATTGKNVPVTILVLNNDVAGSGTLSTITITAQPLGAGGAAVIGNNIVYTPSTTFTGTATIKYKVTNSNNKLSNEATVSVSVVNVIGVTANNDNISTAKNTAITFNPLANDVAGNSTITLVTLAGNPSHGSVTLNPLTNEFTYTPDNNYMGSDSFTYTAKDAYNATATATVSISVLQPTMTGALCGTYAIGTTVQNTYPQFTTITAAVNHLNANGITCPVTFLLIDNDYNNATGESFPIIIDQFNGSSTNNTVTFKPAPYKNVTIQVNDIWVNGSNYQATTVFQLDRADNIIFDGSNAVNGTTRNLTVFNNNSIDYRNRACIWLGAQGNNGAENITIKHTNLKQGYRNQQGLYTMGIYAGRNTISNANSENGRDIDVTLLANGNNANLYVWDNDFINTKQGVYVQGNANNVTTGVNIFQNDLGAEDNQESVILPVSLNNVSNFSVSENQIYNLYRTTTAADLISGGINVKGNSTNGSITKNSLRELQRLTADANTFAGIVLASTSTSSNILVANNYILDPRAKGNGGGYSNGFGMIVDNGGGYRIYHNTVVLTKNQTEVGYSAALYVNSNASNLDVRNNIFVNNQTHAGTRRCAIMVNNDVDNLNAIFTHLDYNNYYSADRIGYIANQQGVNLTWFDNPDFVSTFGGWTSALNATNNTANANNKDSHSINIDPVFVATGDVHLATNNGEMNDKGQFIAEITKDIDGQLRSTTTPDVGADEFGGISVIPTPEPGTDGGIYCTTSTTWENGAWSNGLPETGKDVIFRSDKTFSQDMYACSIFVENGANVNFISESNAYVTHNVNVEEGSSLTFESSCNLMQTENTQNIGTVIVKRNGSKLKRLDYILWSSPVTGTQTLHDFSPNTLDNRFYKYVNATNLYSSVDSYSTTFTKGKSFLIRMPNNHPTTPTVWTGVFEGTPNNGNVYYPLEYLDATHRFNAVGNPYPSPISVAAFIDANIHNIIGTLWVWRKTNDSTQSSYSTITRAGYTANQAPGGSSADNDLIGNPFEIAPNVGVLNAGQGFIVKAKGANKDLVFRNNMRMDLNYANFFRTANNDETPEVYLWSRLWLNVKGPQAENFSQILVGYSSNATMGYDDGYDGTSLSGGDVNLSSIITEGEEEMKLAINARSPFVNTDVVRLGFNTEVAGTFTLELDHVDGLFTGDQNIYIVDALTNNFHNIKEGNYTFSSEIGTFNDRFTIVYATEEELGTTVPVLDAKDVIVYRDGKQISMKAPQEISSVTVYDMLGRTLYENSNINAEEFVTSNIETSQQVVIVKMTFADRQVVSKKIMMN
ncbi:Ig-like domain-containing protein [Flavobacterium sp. MFBS3-15]|uniref:Ig-like domain-containing protein n=1 Tax=Flavobacterium sp. MFBS3-15 TaxID=2989816 RepID=UPI002235DC80|nr:Ig-like domain-containing protein [Flavobacterium sp. MFBS3-15]MCW4470287.1 Ig-like domain-containing protein [Flavobacterium sp. MFBS3-15]